MNIDMNIKKNILDSIAFSRKELGFTLVSEDWGQAEHKCTCAIGCVLLKDKPEDTARIEANKERYNAAAEILGVDDVWIDSFIEGFDANGTSVSSANPEAWELGFEIAKETKPIAYHLWNGNPT
jgi:hypothetical protein